MNRNLYAVIRVDTFQVAPAMPTTAEGWQSVVTVKEVVGSAEEAEAEVLRLNALNSSHGCLYFWQMARPRVVAMKAHDLGEGEPNDE